MRIFGLSTWRFGEFVGEIIDKMPEPISYLLTFVVIAFIGIIALFIFAYILWPIRGIIILVLFLLWLLGVASY